MDSLNLILTTSVILSFSASLYAKNTDLNSTWMTKLAIKGNHLFEICIHPLSGEVIKTIKKS